MTTSPARSSGGPDPAADFRVAPARSEAEFDRARELFREYRATLPADPCFEGFEDELRSLATIYAPPPGELLIALRGGAPVGCVALRRLDETTSEIKRLYVRPGARGHGLGRRLVLGILRVARERGYVRVRLDSLPSMKEAVALYRSLGFRDIAPYWKNPVEDAEFMELELRELPPASPA
jgi:putative acetyltransferase